MTDEEIRQALKPHHDAKAIATFVIGCVLAGITVAGIFVTMGKNQAAIDDIHLLKDGQTRDHDDISSIRYESKAANAGVQELKQTFKDFTADFNAQLRQMNVRHRQQ